MGSREERCQPNLRRRGFDFAFATLIFDHPTVEVEDRRRDYGERRVVAIGVADAVHLTVVYTDRSIRRGEIVRRSSRREGAAVVSGRSTQKRSVEARHPTRGRADLVRLRRTTEAEIARTSPPELADLPEEFWDAAEVVWPVPKQAISLRVDQDVLEWFRQSGPRYQTRMNAVLRTYVTRMQNRGTTPGKKGRRRGAA